VKELKFMPLVYAVASMSKDPSTKVGALALDANLNVQVTGYNGFPRGVADTEERLCNRETKLSFTSHAEANVVAQAAYLGVSLRVSTVLVSSLFPCVECSKLIAQAGVRRVIAPRIKEGRWKESNELARTIFQECGVEVVEIDE